MQTDCSLRLMVLKPRKPQEGGAPGLTQRPTVQPGCNGIFLKVITLYGRMYPWSRESKCFHIALVISSHNCFHRLLAGMPASNSCSVTSIGLAGPRILIIPKIKSCHSSSIWPQPPLLSSYHTALPDIPKPTNSQTCHEHPFPVTLLML